MVWQAQQSPGIAGFVPSQTPQIPDARAAAAVFGPHLSARPVERIAIAHLDQRQRMVRLTVLEGSPEHVPVPLRTMIADALACNAHSIVIAHNHPSGVARPSSADKALTQLIARTLRPIGLRLQDHLIFAGQDWISLRGMGLL